MNMNKRGQGLSTETIILIILGLFILVVLILGFTIGFDKILPWIKSNNNIDTVSKACQTSCVTNNKYDFCSFERELKAEDLPLDAEGKEQKSVKESCKFLSEDADYTKYGIATCPGLC